MEVSERKHKKKEEENYLQLYRIPPTETISLEEFEELAVERLKVLKAVETTGVRFAKESEEYEKHFRKEIGDNKLRVSILEKTVDQQKGLDAKRKDLISHFILRLAYCKSDELRRWFIQQEVDLFRFRYWCAKPETRVIFMAENKLDYHPIPQKEKECLLENLKNSEGKDESEVNSTQHYMVPFTEALDLVRGRRVFVHKGFAYVPQDDLVSILLTIYRMELSHSLAITARALPHLEEDSRLLPMLSTISRRYIGQDYTTKKPVGEITADMIDILSKQSFPLCMQQLHSALRSNHHLRHGGRMQYGLFLKGIGMSLEETIKFWRAEFTKIMDADKFDKQYAYGIRHNFGKEGKKTDYTPYSCVKIITSNAPGVGDFHGCPFKHCEQDLLRQKLAGQGVSREGVDQVMHFVKGGHFQVACAKLFELVHGVQSEDGEDVEVSFHHPNQYFEESYKRLSKSENTAPTPKTPRGVKRIPPSQGSSQGSSQGFSQGSQAHSCQGTQSQSSIETPSKQLYGGSLLSQISNHSSLHSSQNEDEEMSDGDNEAMCQVQVPDTQEMQC